MTLRGKVRVRHKNKGYRALLKDRNIGQDLKRRAQAIAEASGEGFVAASPLDQKGKQDKNGRWRDAHGRFVDETGFRRRARAAVIAVTFEARRENSADNTLLRNLDAGRD